MPSDIPRRITRALRESGGFTLIEMIIVISILSIMALIVAPRISNFMGRERGSFIILTSLIAKTFDDSFIRERTNFLVVHLYERDLETAQFGEDIFSRENGVSVVLLDKDGRFVDSPNRLLKYQGFSASSFRIDEAVFPNRETARRGNVFIPFHPGGFSDNVILHITVGGDQRWSVRIFKLKKEAAIIPEHVGFD